MVNRIHNERIPDSLNIDNIVPGAVEKCKLGKRAKKKDGDVRNLEFTKSKHERLCAQLSFLKNEWHPIKSSENALKHIWST